MNLAALVHNIAVVPLPGTKGALDRDFNLVVTEAEVQTAIDEVRASKAQAEEVLGKIDGAVFEGPAKDREGAIRQVKETCSASAAQLAQAEQQLLGVLGRIREQGGSWAYLGAEFTARFGNEPLEVQRLLALASGRIGLNKVSLGLLERSVTSQLEAEVQSFQALKQSDTKTGVDWSAEEQKASAKLAETRTAFEQARAALAK